MVTPDLKNKLTPRQYLIMNLFLGLVICVGALILFYLLANAVTNKGAVVQLDDNVAAVLNSWATPDMTRLMLGISLFGLQILWAVVAAVAVYCWIKRQWNHLAMWLIAWLGSELLTQILKLSFHRPRPVVPHPLITAAQFSFPSGHASVSLVVYGMLAFFILLAVRSAAIKTLVLVATILFVLLIGISRLYLGVHFFSDVAAGYVTGVIWLTLCIDGMNILEHRKYLRNAKPPAQPEKTDAERARETA